MFVEFQWEFKSVLANQYASKNKISIKSALFSAAYNVFEGKKYVLERILKVYKRKGARYAVRYARRL